VTDETLADDVAPEAPGGVSVTVGRGHAPAEGCGAGSTSCDDIGSVTLRLDEPATDDQSSTEHIGYRIELADGVLPGTLRLPDTAVRANGGTELELFFVDDATEAQEVVAFSLVLTPIDEAGNVGPPSTEIRVFDPGGAEGCRVARRATSLDAALLFGLVAIARRMARQKPWR